MGSILSPAPFYLIDLLFYFERFEVIEFGLMRLKLGVKLVLACFFLDQVSSSASAKASCGINLELVIPSRSSRITQLALLCPQSLGSFLYDRIQLLK
jgi:hypothetical protein